MESVRLQRLARLCLGLLVVVVPLAAVAAIDLFSATAEPVQAAPLYQGGGPVVSFSSQTYSRAENAGSISISVEISEAPTNTVTVEFLTVPGTATEDSDYLRATGVLTFPVGSTASQNFSVSIVNDDVDEPNETVNLILRNPVNASLGTDTATLTILDDDVAPTDTPTPTTGAPPVFVDDYEPNNTFAEAYTTASDAAALCDITLWPTGDEDYFRFVGKAGSTYEILTTNLDAGLDTELIVYDTELDRIASNDDRDVGSRASRVVITADVDGFYYARVVNRSPSDPADKTYCFEVNEIQPPTPTPSQTPVPGADECEFNSTIEYACLIGVGEVKNLSFVPVYGSEQDTDIFRLWMKAGIEYTCETFNLSPVADTNMIFLDANGNDFNPPLGNDDKAPGELGSRLSYRAAYTGWLYIEVGPYPPPPYEEAPLHTYDLTCTATVATATPTATNTVPPPPPGTGGGGPSFQPSPSPTPLPTVTPIDFSFLTPSPSPTPPLVQFQPLPTRTPAAGGQQSVTINVTLYYDSNSNYMPELTEGIVDVEVALYDNATGQLLQFGHTNEAGMVRFEVVTSGTVRIVVPFLNYSQVVVGTNPNILLRVAPQPLPIGIP